MLRINLLPVRQLKKRAKARNQIFTMILAFCCLLVFLGFVGVLQNGMLHSLNNQIAQLNKQKDAFKPILAQIETMKKQKQELERKTAIIKTLRAESSLTVRVLDDVAKYVDNKRLWLDSLSQQGPNLSLTGVALDNETVAQFMDKLKSSEFIIDVNLANSSLKVIAGRNLKSFVMTCTTTAQPPVEVAAAPKK
ncbi:MAG: PilN domain-containing protein [Desulfoprunum sp.]|jgi:type IV pilus assembly protein PilN|nr:pilus assembly protein PilN [Desulfobulbus sp. Tol-SR]